MGSDDMERLTKRFDNGEAFCNNPFVVDDVGVDETILTGKLIDKLAQYEEAEEQGLFVKIECHCKDCKYWADKVAGCTEHVKFCTIGGYMVGENGYCVYGEQVLKQMGE